MGFRIAKQNSSNLFAILKFWSNIWNLVAMLIFVLRLANVCPECAIHWDWALTRLRIAMQTPSPYYLRKINVCKVDQSCQNCPPFIDCQRARSGLFIEEMEARVEIKNCKRKRGLSNALPSRDWELHQKRWLSNAILLGKGHICSARFCCGSSAELLLSIILDQMVVGLTDNSWTRWQIICHFLIWTWTAIVFCSCWEDIWLGKGWSLFCGQIHTYNGRFQTDARLIWKVWLDNEYCLRRRNRATGEVSNRDMSQLW